MFTIKWIFITNVSTFIMYLLIIIIVSNYEVNSIQKSYLKRWEENENEDNFILTSSFLNEFQTDYRGFVKLLLHSRRMYCDDYFLFITLISFFEPHDVLNVLLSSSYLNKPFISVVLKIFF